jgi:hypothetical protein
MAKTPQTFRFKLSDREFAMAWLREYYRRPGWRSIRVLGGPLMVMVGVALRGSSQTFTSVMGIVAIVFGVYYALKPIVFTSVLTSQRRRRNSADVEIEVTFDRDGMRVADGKAKTALPWERITASGVTDEYVWIELSNGNRATIPRRAIPDLEELRALLSARVADKRS